MLGRTPQPAKPRQSEDQPPLSIGAGVEDLGRDVAGDEPHSRRVAAYRDALPFRERIHDEQSFLDGIGEELAGASTVTTNSIRKECLEQRPAVIFGIGGRDVVKQFVLAEILVEVTLCLGEVPGCPTLVDFLAVQQVEQAWSP